MAKYREKSVIVDAIRWDGKNHRGMFEFLGGDPNEYIDTSGEHFLIDHDRVEGGLVIKTSFWDRIARIGDWVVKSEDGRYFPMEPLLFDEIYESLNGPPLQVGEERKG